MAARKRCRAGGRRLRGERPEEVLPIHDHKNPRGLGARAETIFKSARYPVTVKTRERFIEVKRACFDARRFNRRLVKCRHKQKGDYARLLTLLLF